MIPRFVWTEKTLVFVLHDRDVKIRAFWLPEIHRGSPSAYLSISVHDPRINHRQIIDLVGIGGVNYRKMNCDIVIIQLNPLTTGVAYIRVFILY